MTIQPMFPLGSVLFPHMPLPLRIFEERYLVMLSEILESEPSEFGVVLIERGQEVGGSDHRFGVGTIAQVSELEGAEGFVAVIAHGDRRFEVVDWLEDDPYPRAVIRELPDLEWAEDLLPLRGRAEHVVRRALALASEFTDQSWSAIVELDDDPVAAAWQLAAIAPLEQLDQVALLGVASLEELLETVIDLTTAAERAMQSSWSASGGSSDLDDELDALGG